MLSKFVKLPAITLSVVFVTACVPDPWPGTLQFGESNQSELAAVLQLSSGDIFSVTNKGVVYRLTNSGEILWSVSLPVEGFSTRRAVSDKNGDIYIAGEYDYGDRSAPYVASAILKIDSDGNIIWTRYFPCANGYVNSNGVAVDTNNAMYAQFSADCDAFLATERQGEMDNVILKMDSGTGDVLWTRREGEPGAYLDSIAGGIAVNAAGEPIAMNFPMTDTVSLRVQKLSAEGQLLLEQNIEEQFVGFGNPAVDAEGNLYLGGITLGFSFFDQPLVGSGDTALLKMNSDLEVAWARVIGSAGNDDSRTGVAMDKSGNLYLGGNTWGALPGNEYQGQSDAFISKWSPDGLHQWTVQIGTDSNDWGYAVGISREGGAFLAGGTSGDLAPDAVAGERLFISKLTPDGTIISK